MGCDIHMLAEYYDTNTKSWQQLTLGLTACWACEGKGVDEDEGKTCWSCQGEKQIEKDWYDGRNYDEFAILADVRNGHGFAGIKTGGGFVPIDQPRGIPEDASPETKEMSDGWNGDGHSHSWLSLADLDGYDWTRKTTHVGQAGPKAYTAWKETGRPSDEGMYGWIMGKTVAHLTNQEMEERILKNDFDPGIKYVTDIEWEVPYAECAPQLMGDIIPNLRKAALEKGLLSDQVRIVFFFDN